MKGSRVAHLCAITLVWAALPATGLAQVARIEIDRREPFADGQSFGEVGPYERLVGSLYLEVDPDDPANQRITDIHRAPVNQRGRVEVRTDFYLLKPVDPSRGSGRLLYDVNNRGGKVALGTFNGAGGNDPDRAGSGFLMERGYSVLWTGWSGDVLPGGGRLTTDVPVASDDDATLTGRVYVEMESGGYQLYRNNFVTQSSESADQLLYSIPFDWGASLSYPSATLDNGNATLTMRPDRSAAPTEIPRDAWGFARHENGQVIPDASQLYVHDGFRLGWLYDLVYMAENPRVTGLGMANVRDPVSFFRYAESDDMGQPNPLAGAIRLAYGFGVSQSGRYLHHFIWDGFNTDTEGRPVFDGVFVEVAGGGKGLFNYRFWQTTRHGSQHEENLYPSDFFPFTSVPQEDPLTGERGDMFERARAAGNVPKVMFLQTSTEYWSRAASLLHTDVQGTRDIDPDPSVRIYMVTGAPHTSMTGGHYDNPLNRLSRGPVSRALFAALDEWVADGVEPPPNRYPRIDDGTLVTLDVYRASFPDIPGSRMPTAVYRPIRLDPGPRWRTAGISDNAPPRVGERYTTLVPAVDSDGNDVAGVRLPDIAVPVDTRTGWNLRTEAWGADGMLTRWMGSVFDFPVTRADREASGDPRPAILERYPTRDAYLRRVSETVRGLQEGRFLLPADAASLLVAAEERSFWASQVVGPGNASLEPVIRGTVVDDQSGLPIGGAWVRVLSEGGAWVGPSVTGRDGRPGGSAVRVRSVTQSLTWGSRFGRACTRANARWWVTRCWESRYTLEPASRAVRRPTRFSSPGPSRTSLPVPALDSSTAELMH